MRVLENSNFEFVSRRRVGYIISGTLLALSLVSFLTRGIELGIDFRGGMEFVVASDEALPVTEVRAALASELGADPEVKTYGEAILIRVPAVGEMTQIQGQVLATIAESFPGSNPTMEKTDIVGPRFAEDLKEGALYSVLGSLLVIFVYILIRFEWRFGLGAVSALFHDVIITLGIFSLLQGVVPFSLQIDQALIAAFLTIVGYSINDTVVVFDRIREFTNIFKTEPYETVVNRSINSTLSRTVVTSGTTLLVVITLFIFGGEVLRGFAFALIVGIIIGTYSTIFVASPMVVELRLASKTSR